MNTTAAAAIFLLVAFSSGAFADWLPINCNRTFFTHGVSLCQKTAIESLARSKDTTCDIAYNNQVWCITNHVKKCLRGTDYYFLSSLVVNFLKVITFNCGSGSGSVSSILYGRLNCKTGAKQKFEQATKCWNDFATKYKTNRADSTLCNSVADAKNCVANITNHYCPEVNLDADSNNPFCENSTNVPTSVSPAQTTTEQTFPPNSLNCQKDFYYQKERECENTFIEVLTNTKSASSCSNQVPEFKFCIKRHYKEKCFSPFVDDSLLERLTNGVLGVTKGLRLFCGPVSVTNTSGALRDIISCGSMFYEEAESCSKEFREQFQNQPYNHTVLCSVYANAKSCFSRIQERYCSFNPSILQIIKDTYNPFCKGKRKVSCGLAMYSTWFSLVMSVMLFIIYP